MQIDRFIRTVADGDVEMVRSYSSSPNALLRGGN